MTTRRYGLRDDQWERIKDLLPGREGSVGVSAKPSTTACLSKPCSTVTVQAFHGATCQNGLATLARYIRYALQAVGKDGRWEQVFQSLAEDADNEYAMVD